MFAATPFPVVVQLGKAQFHQSRRRGQISRFWAALWGRSRKLLQLSEMSSGTRRGGRYLGVQLVPVSQIQGTEGRCGDFDSDFNPLNANTEARWLSIYNAWDRGTALPLVELIRVDEIYYVRDGHHRISVAGAMGQDSIEAVVTAWE